MTIPILIYCAAGNKRFAEIAIRHGFQYGAQLPNTIYFEPYFADQNWKKPVRQRYMNALAKYRPTIATVLDWEHRYQFPEVMRWAQEASQFVSDSVIVIPKVIGGIRFIPRTINGKDVRLGYSAASTFSGTPVSLGEFRGWPVHCLGGSPSVQMDVSRKMDVRSADGNFIQQVARQRAQFYSPGQRAKHNSWPLLQEIGLGHLTDAPYIAFELSCIAVQAAWHGMSGPDIFWHQVEHLKSIDIRVLSIQTKLAV